MKQNTIHISFAKDDLDLYHEIIRESSLSYIPASALVRNYLRKGMKDSQRQTVSR